MCKVRALTERLSYCKTKRIYTNIKCCLFFYTHCIPILNKIAETETAMRSKLYPQSHH